MRKPVASMFSLAVVCSLFLAMSWMIEFEGVAEASMPPPTIPAPQVEPPEPPPPNTKPDEPDLPPLQPDRGPEVDLPPPDNPQRPQPPRRFESMDTRTFVDPPEGSAGVGAEATPRMTVPPQYPREALTAGLEGWVRIEFTIAPDGSVLNASIVDAHPRRGLFDDAALSAVSRWIYHPATENGAPVVSHGHRVTIEFNMASRR